MTKQEFIDNFELEKKLEELKKLKEMNFEDWFINIYGPHLEKSIIKGIGDISLAKDYDFFEKIHFNQIDKNLNLEEKENYNHFFKRYLRSYKNRTSRLEQEIKDFYRNLEYFCEIPNLSFEEWLNTYYIENLKKIPEEEFALKYKKERLLRVDVFNGKLEEKEYLELMNHDPIEAYQSKTYIKSDYCEYLKTQITYPTIQMEYFHI